MTLESKQYLVLQDINITRDFDRNIISSEYPKIIFQINFRQENPQKQSLKLKLKIK